MRKSLLGKQDFKKYAIYALSEIFLVVIGILVALGLNNWNQERKNHKEEIILLKSIRQQVSNDITTLSNNIEQTKLRRLRVVKIIEMLNKPEDIDVEEFSLLQMDLTTDNYFVSQRAIFDEAVSSGKLGLIQNDSLRQRLFQYYNAISNDRDNDRLQFKVTNELIVPIMVEELGTTKEMLTSYTRRMGILIDPPLPKFDAVALSKNQRYFEAIMYALGDTYQERDWRAYLLLASRLNRAIKFELRDYGFEVE